MSNYIITYVRGDSERVLSFKVRAESEGEAVEIWESYADGLDDFCELVSVREA